MAVRERRHHGALDTRAAVFARAAALVHSAVLVRVAADAHAAALVRVAVFARRAPTRYARRYIFLPELKTAYSKCRAFP